MGLQLTGRVIKQLCGHTSYERGEAYYKRGKVAIIDHDPETNTYEAVVEGSSSYEVSVEIDRHGDVDADCSCPAFYSYDNYCKHIAAVLLHLMKEQDSKEQTSSRKGVSLLHPEKHSRSSLFQLEPRYDGSIRRSSEAAAAYDLELMEEVMGIFDSKPQRSSGARSVFDTRERLSAEFTVKPVAYGYRKVMLGLEMKVGPKRLYIVQKIRDFLERIDRRESFLFTKNFSYVPELHGFQPHDDEVIRRLIHIYRNERMYRDTSQNYWSNTNLNDRVLLLPPYAWNELMPLLTAAQSVKLEDHSGTYDGLRISDEPIPIRFEFDQDRSEGYRLEVQGLDEITVLEPYGVVLAEGKLIRLKPELCQRLTELEQTLESTRKNRIRIPQQQIEPFMEKVIPGLRKLGNVQITQVVSDRIVQTPLKAKLFLDRVRDRLLAGLEFHYGSIMINPLEATLGSGRENGHILLRDGEKEGRILELMEHANFAKTEGGYFMTDEEAEYDFLYYTVPQLETLLEVFATTSVKARIFTGSTAPKVKIDVDERTDWLEFKFDMDGIPESEIRHVLKALEEKRKYHKLPTGALMPLETEELQEIIKVMNELGLRGGDMQGTEARLPAIRGLRLMDAEKPGKSVRLGKSFRRLLDNMRNPDNLDFAVPESLTAVLRDYQKYGYQWLKTLAYYGFGGILADDMGLGKTLQSIAFLVSVAPEIRSRQQPAIIVSPASLMYNWLNELQRFAPELRAAIADGTKSERSRILKEEGLRADVIITSYPLLRRDVELYSELTFHTLILDEAQAFKNHSTQTAQAVKELKAQYRFALTGTPVENRLEELWSIFDTVFPDLFPGRKAFNELTREAVSKRIRPFLLRRLKTDVLKELPEKIETLQASELLPEQKKLYAAYLARLQQDTLKHLNEEGFGKNRIKILAGITRLRQLCCHPALFVEDYEGSSAKFEQLLEVIEECRSAGRRALIFSQFTEMLGLIGRELGQQGVPYFYLDGSTPASARIELCNRFNDGERELFLISLKAGGTGLNLTGADTVILYDLWWNPAVEQQAADRAHRMGQKNVVQVIRLVAQGTVEDKMYELQQRKKNLIDEVIQPGQESLSSLSEQELREILMID